jgi:hypothetical protein
MQRKILARIKPPDSAKASPQHVNLSLTYLHQSEYMNWLQALYPSHATDA